MKQNCTKIAVTAVRLETIVGAPLNTSIWCRLGIARKISRWTKQNNDHQALLILSDYGFPYRMLVHFCRANKTPIFLYQDGFIFFEPWSKNILGYLKRLIYRTFKILGVDYLISYQSFHTNPDLIFSWGDFFTRIFKLKTHSNVITLGSTIYAKNYKLISSSERSDGKMLYYSTFYRDIEKDLLSKREAVTNLKSIISLDEDLICDVKLHPLDKNRIYFEQLLQKNMLNARIHMLSNNFQLSENIENYKIIISEFSTETIFASMFHKNVLFVKNILNEKHFKTLSDFLKNQRIADKEYYRADPNLTERFQAEYFQKFNVERFEQAVQKHY
ncbi:MAG TPA: hypothetical protein VGQ59_02360 [Cyclobacteriaceae bacterium]|nr:hypothetical protein [Cyclobacteriaceae bacterium]